MESCSCCYVSTPFLPNRSRYDAWTKKAIIVEAFQHLFFLTEVATKSLKREANYIGNDINRFQHLFFLTEVATHEGFYDPDISKYFEFQHLFFLTEVATMQTTNVKNYCKGFNTFSS
jgi:hypothetical protein